MAHIAISPPILYWGTPVVLISTLNPDGTPNLAPMSSAFWLGNRCMLGLASHSQTTMNLRRTKQCVLNLASDDMVTSVNALARTTGSDPIPARKVTLGYRIEKDKFGIAKLTQQKSTLVGPPRVQECPVQMEAELSGEHVMMDDVSGARRGAALAIEVTILQVHVLERLRMKGHQNRIDPDLWRPMIMSFQQLYGLRDGKLDNSKLAEIDEELYRGPDAKPKSTAVVKAVAS